MQRPVGLAREQFAPHFRGQNRLFFGGFCTCSADAGRAPENAAKAPWLLGFGGFLVALVVVALGVSDTPKREIGTPATH